MKITFDTNSVESLNTVEKQISEEIARIEKEGRNAKKNKEKIKTVFKTDKVAVPVRADDVNAYKSLLGFQEGIKFALKDAMARTAEVESAVEVHEETENKESVVEETPVQQEEHASAVTDDKPVLEEKKDDSLVVNPAAEEAMSDDELLDAAVAAEDRYFSVYEKAQKAIAASEEEVRKAKENHDRLVAQLESRYPAVKNDPDARLAQEQLDAARKDFVSFLGNTTQMLNQKELQARLEADQKKAAAADVKTFAENAAKKAEEAKRRAAIYAQQAKAAGDDLIKVAEHRALQEGATPEDIANVQKAKDAVHANNIGQSQRLVAADQVLAVANNRVATAKDAERKANIEAEQQQAAYADTKKVIDSRYRKIKGEIIQDLPIHSKEEQTFKTKGMSDEEIKASQEKLAAVPEVRQGNATPTRTWQEMSRDINNLMLKRSHDDKNLNLEDIYALYFLRSHPEAAPSKEYINELLLWAGIAPLEKSTPSHTKPAGEQEKAVNKESEVIADPSKKDEVRKTMTDKEIEETRSETKKEETPVHVEEHHDVEVASEEQTPIMTDEEIEEVKGLIDNDRQAKEEAERQAALAKFTPVKKEETPKKEDASKKKSTDTKKKGGKHLRKVTKKESLKSRISKSALINKFLNKGKKKSYVDARNAIQALEKTYQTNDPATNKQTINDIYSMIDDARMEFNFVENRILYGSLGRLSKKIKTFEANKAKGIETKDNLTEEEHAEIAAVVDDVMRQKAEAGSEDSLSDFMDILDEEGQGRSR